MRRPLDSFAPRALTALLTAVLLSCARSESSAESTVASATASAPAPPSAAPPASAAPAPAAPARVFDLYPEGVPGLLADAPAETIKDGRVYNVGLPTLSFFPAPRARSTGTAVIVCPGGGYVRLAVEKEGSAVTRFLNGIGVSAFVLKYRTAPYRYPAALKDVLRAIRFARSKAAELGINAHRVGVFGSSAGGHLAASAASLFASDDGKTGNPLDEVDARPDFVALLYPVITMKDPHAHAGSRSALLGEHPPRELVERNSLELAVTAQNPPTFLVHTSEDQSVPVENSLLFYRALRKAGVPAELHVYEKGPHGFGLRADLGTTSEWPKRFEDWLGARGLLAAPGG